MGWFKSKAQPKDLPLEKSDEAMQGETFEMCDRCKEYRVVRHRCAPDGGCAIVPPCGPGGIVPVRAPRANPGIITEVHK